MTKVEKQIVEAKKELWKGVSTGLLGIVVSGSLSFLVSPFYSSAPSLVLMAYIVCAVTSILSMLTLCLSISLLMTYRSVK